MSKFYQVEFIVSVVVEDRTENGTGLPTYKAHEYALQYMQETEPTTYAYVAELDEYEAAELEAQVVIEDD